MQPEAHTVDSVPLVTTESTTELVPAAATTAKGTSLRLQARSGLAMTNASSEYNPASKPDCAQHAHAAPSCWHHRHRNTRRACVCKG